MKRGRWERAVSKGTATPTGLVVLMSSLFMLEASLYASVSPLLPSYARAFSLTKAGTGLLTAAYPAGVIIGAAAVSRARSISPRHLTLAGLSTMAVATVSFGFDRSAILLDLTRLAQGIACGGIWGGGLGWLSLVTTPSDRGRAFGWVFGAATFGTMFGPIIGTFAATFGTRIVFGVVGGISAALFVVVIRRQAVSSADESKAVVTRRVDRRCLATGILAIMVPAAGIGSLTVLIPLRLSALGGSSRVIGATFLVASAIATAASVLAGRLSDRRGRWLPIEIGIALGCCCLGLLSLRLALIFVALATVGYLGLALNLSTSPAIALVSDVADLTRWASAVPAIALFSFSTAELFGALGGATLADASSDTFTYGALAVLGLGAFAAVRRSSQTMWSRVAVDPSGELFD